MDDQSRLTAFLIRAQAKSYCDDCLANALSLPLRDVQQQLTEAVEEGWAKQFRHQCACCGSHKLVSCRRMSAFAA